jgi:hypothetical protein
VRPKSVAEKLLVKPDATVWASDPKRIALIEPLPTGARVVRRLDQASVAIVFADDEASLRRSLAKHGPRLGRPGTLWVAYPKGNKADINRDTVWPMVAEHGLRPISQVAVDETWSALRFRRLEPGEPQFTGGRTR